MERGGGAEGGGGGALRGEFQSRGLIWKPTNPAPSSTWAASVTGHDWWIHWRRDAHTRTDSALVRSLAHTRTRTREGRESVGSLQAALWSFALERLTVVEEGNWKRRRKAEDGEKTQTRAFFSPLISCHVGSGGCAWTGKRKISLSGFFRCLTYFKLPFVCVRLTLGGVLVPPRIRCCAS